MKDISIEPFRGDVENLERMALSSWRDEYKLSSFPNLYRPLYLKFLFERIPDRRHLIAAYRGDEILCFFANLPRKFHFQGKIYRAVLSCLLVTGKEMLRRGLATSVIEEALRINKELKYDFALLYLEKGHRSTLFIKKLKEMGHPLEWVKKMCVVGRILDFKRVSTSENLKTWEKMALQLIGAHRQPELKHGVPVREYSLEDLDSCLSLLNEYQHKVRLSLFWEKEELAWELYYPHVSQTLVYVKEKKVEGLINFVFHEHHGKSVEKWAWVNHVAYPSLSRRERLDFVKAFLIYVQRAGCVGVIEWRKKYYPQEPFYRAGFFPYFRCVNLYSWTFNPQISLRRIPDVYEVQI